MGRRPRSRRFPGWRPADRFTGSVTDAESGRSLTVDYRVDLLGVTDLAVGAVGRSTRPS